jgi:hypothetical protein
VLVLVESRVFYIDTKNDLSPERLLEIFHKGKLLAAAETAGPDISCLGRIHVAKAFEAAALLEILRYS